MHILKEVPASLLITARAVPPGSVANEPPFSGPENCPFCASQALRRGRGFHESLIVVDPTVVGSIIMTCFLLDATTASYGPVATYDLPRWWVLSRAHHHGD